jgi:hypothetical protein
MAGPAPTARDLFAALFHELSAQDVDDRERK